MRTLEEIKKKYLSDPWFNRPYDEEIEHYGLNQSIYKEWITEELLEFKKILFLKIDQFDNVFNSIDEFNHKNMLFSDIYSIIMLNRGISFASPTYFIFKFVFFN